MKVYNFFLLLTCLALTPSLISSNFLLYGSNEVESAALNLYGNEEVCPREEDMKNFVDQEENGSGLISFELQSFAVGSPVMSIDEILGDISSRPFEQLEGKLLWENGQALVDGIEETAQSMVEKAQESVAPVVEAAEETVECVEAFVVESYEDLLQFYELFPWFNEAADEECVGEEEEELGKTPEATEEEEKELEAVVEQQIAPIEVAPVAVAEEVPEVERKKALRMINSIISAGFLGSLALAYLSIASVFYVALKDDLAEKYDAETKQHFYKVLARLRKDKRRKAARKALTAPVKPLALPAPPPPKKDQDAQTEVLPWPLDGECSSETNVSMEDVSQSCA